jgi:hypothetical protein
MLQEIKIRSIMLVRETSVRSAAVSIALLLSLPNAASAAVLSLYGPFDYRNPGNSGHYRPKRDISQPPSIASDGLMGCGRGRLRDAATHRCRGPADIR